MTRGPCREVEHLLRQVQDGIDEGRSDGRLLPMLVRLARQALPDSPPWVWAQQQIAERIVTVDPWRASLLARRVLRVTPDDDRAWAVLAVAQCSLGHRRYAFHAFRQALSLRPNYPWYAYELGRLLDRALGRPAQALPLLEYAWRWSRDDPEVATALAHALSQVGQIRRALALLEPIVHRGASAEQLGLYHALRERRSLGEDPPKRLPLLFVVGADGPRRRSRKRRRTTRPCSQRA